MFRVFQIILILVGLIMLISTAAIAIARENNSPTWLYFTSDFALYRMYPDGSHLELLMDEVNMYGGDWSPDHQWLIFSGNEAAYGFADLYRFNVYTRRLELIAATDLSDRFVEWSPDHEWIVFIADSEEYYREYHLIRPNGSGQREILSQMRMPIFGGFSPDGEWILNESGTSDELNLFLERISGSERQQLTHSQTYNNIWRITPDHEWILYTGFEEGQPDVYRMRWDGSDRQNLTHAINESVDGQLLSPDGQWIITTHYGDTYTMYRVRIDGTETAQLLTLPERYDFQAWSSDSEWFYFSMGFENGADIYRLNVFTADVEQLTDSENADLLEWLSADGRWLWYASTPLKSPGYEIFVLDLENHGRQSLGVYSSSISVQLVSEDNQWVYFHRAINEEYNALYRMHVDGTGLQRVTELPGYINVIGWSPQLSTTLPITPFAAIGLLTAASGGVWAIVFRRT